MSFSRGKRSCKMRLRDKLDMTGRHHLPADKSPAGEKKKEKEVVKERDLKK